MIVNYKKILLFSLIVPVLIGFRNGFIVSDMGDLQYYPSKLLFDGINFYEEAIKSLETGSSWFLSQFPNYYFSLYFFLSPFTVFGYDFFKFFWFLLNIILLYKSIFIIKSFPNMNWKEIFIVFIPLILGFPLSNVLGVGQFGIILLYTFVSLVKSRSTINYFSYGVIVFSKFSFGIPLFIDFLFKKQIKVILLSSIFLFSFPLLYSFLFDISIFKVFEYLMIINNKSTGKGPFDLMSLSIDFFNNKISPFYLSLVSIITVLFIKKNIGIIQNQYQVLFFPILFSFIVFFHGHYDYLLFVLPLIYLKINKQIKVFYISYFLFLFYCITPRIMKYIFDFDLNFISNIMFYENTFLRIFGILLMVILLFNQ